MTVAEAAKKIGKSPQFVRVCLQQQILPFGVAVKTGKKNYNYYINEYQLRKYLGEEINE